MICPKILSHLYYHCSLNGFAFINFIQPRFYVCYWLLMLGVMYFDCLEFIMFIKQKFEVYNHMHLAYVWKCSLFRIHQFHWIKVLQLQWYAPLYMTLLQQQKGCLRCVRKVYFELPPKCINFGSIKKWARIMELEARIKLIGTFRYT
jgi:hypothetical protein